jgi:hypothetical protein
MRYKLLSLCLAVALAVASFGAVGCKPDSNSNTGNNKGNGEAVDKLFVGLRLAVAGSGPLLDLLVSQGKLSREKADFIRDDFASVVNVVDTLKNNVRAATDTAGKLAAAQTAYRAFKDIYGLGHFGLDPTILAAANIADGIFAAIVDLYGGQVTPAPRSSAPSSASEKRAAIEAKIEDLRVTLEVK